MINSTGQITGSSKKIGIAADHGGFELKEYIKKRLSEEGYAIIDFGNSELNPADDYPDYVIPLATAMANGTIRRGIAICGSGVGVCVAANKVAGIRACLIHEEFSAKQGVEDDDMNVICLGGRVLEYSFAWELISIFLEAKFIDVEKHTRRLKKVAELENSKKVKQ